MHRQPKAAAIGLFAVLALISLAYSNHFGNAFQFDDSHAVVDNPYIRDLHNFPRFFTDTSTSTSLPSNRSWRPLVTASLALDYWLGKGLTPAWFHASTFFWFLLQICLMYALFRRICDLARPDPLNRWIALFSAALYGLHPAMAETVNYVAQRGDLYSTLGVIAGLVIYLFKPGWRKYGFYLLPVAAALLSKPPALVFPAILFAYVRLFEEVNLRKAAVRCIPSLLLAGAFAVISALMVPKTFNPGASAAAAYRMTQPLVALRYFGTFFLPVNLSADTDHLPVAGVFHDYAWLGFLFVAAILATAVWCSRKRTLRPIAFGLYWFILALIPTSIFALAEIENDHRMFFPFVGLSLSVCWAAGLLVYRISLRRGVVAFACGLVLAACAWGTMRRNRVWHTGESLWYDVTVKSPRNGRGLMNYGLALMARGDYPKALDYFQRALVYNPGYMVLEVNLGVVNGALKNDAEAERHFKRALALAPSDAIPNYFYAVWLEQKRRIPEALACLNLALAGNPSYMQARYLLMSIYAEQHDSDRLRVAAADTLAQFPSDEAAKSWLARASDAPSADTYLDRSLALYRQGKFTESIEAARAALKLRKDYAPAWNNIAAAYNSLGRWDEGIEAAEQAVRADPGFQLAKNNLAWARDQKRKTAAAR
jgi:tetratricopeptide (TPR) repeat protein